MNNIIGFILLAALCRSANAGLVSFCQNTLINIGLTKPREVYVQYGRDLVPVPSKVHREISNRLREEYGPSGNNQNAIIDALARDPRTRDRFKGPGLAAQRHLVFAIQVQYALDSPFTPRELDGFRRLLHKNPEFRIAQQSFGKATNEGRLEEASIQRDKITRFHLEAIEAQMGLKRRQEIEKMIREVVRKYSRDN